MFFLNIRDNRVVYTNSFTLQSFALRGGNTYGGKLERPEKRLGQKLENTTFQLWKTGKSAKKNKKKQKLVENGKPEQLKKV